MEVSETYEKHLPRLAGFPTKYPSFCYQAESTLLSQFSLAEENTACNDSLQCPPATYHSCTLKISRYKMLECILSKAPCSWGAPCLLSRLLLAVI